MQAITIHRLQIFLAVCEQRSFNKAADILFMSQAAVSQHIQNFEASIGNKLFERSPRGVTLTPAGKKLKSYAEKIISLVAEAEHAVINVAELQDQSLQIGATPGLGVYLLPQLLRRFQTAYPNIGLSLQSALVSESVSKVLSRHYDFGFVEGHLSDLDVTQIDWHDLDLIDYVLVVHPEHRWSGLGSVEAEALAAEPFLARQPTSRSRRWIERSLAEKGVELTNIVAELDSPGTIKYSLFSQLGVSILPDYSVERELERGDLIRVRIEGIELVRPVKLIWERGRILGPVQQAFLRIGRM